MNLGIGLECARATGHSFEEALEQAVIAGYDHVEPFIYADLEVPINSHVVLRTDSPYHHLHAGHANAAAISASMERFDLRFSAFDAHTSLLIPQIGVPHLCGAIDLAARVGCPIVISDEGPVPTTGLSLETAFDVFCSSLEPVLNHADRQGVHFAVELHNALTTQPQFLSRLLQRFQAGALSVNFDTGNCFLAGNDPVSFLEQFVDRVAHVHLKDIPAHQAHLRGKVTGTRVGVAAGTGLVDIPGIVRTLRSAGYKGTLSVECETWDQARASRGFLQELFQTQADTRPGSAP